ncbi:hypothetical protein Agub_g387, partial [Astrephomene gubernaculifera]
LLARLAALPDKLCRLQACSGLVSLLADGGLWQQLQQLLDACFLAFDTAAACGIAPQSVVVQVPGGGAGTAAAVRQQDRLPLSVSCTLVTAAVQRLCTAAASQQAAASGGDASTASQLLRQVLSRLRGVLRPLLTSPTAGVRQAALKALVPAVLACAQTC